MLIVSAVFFAPVLDGMKLVQGDTQKFESMTKETKDYHAKTGDYAMWNSSMFGGMPIYQVGGNPPVQSVLTPIKNTLTMHFAGVDGTIGVLFFYLIGFYVALVVLGCSPWLALVGALGFGLGSYNVIIVEAGHITKAWAMAMMAPILAGMVLCLRRGKEGRKKTGDWLWGGLLFVLALGLQLHCNHIQITYYTILGAALLGVAHGVYALVEKRLPQFGIGLGVLLLGCVLAFACNARNLMVSQEYAKYTMRGGNDITIGPEALDGGMQKAEEAEKKSGLDVDYAFAWSYGVGETYTLLVPGAMGGGSGERVGKESASYKAFRQEQMPLYWGDQPFTSGPVYFGAIVIFLALMGLILVKGPERWWLLAAALVGVVLSWGRNWMGLNEWVFDHLPLYNKFRTPSMALVLTNVCAVLLAALGLKELFSTEVSQKRKNMALYVSGGVTAAVVLIGLMMSGGLSYSGAADEQMAAQYGAQWAQIQSVFIQDRKALFAADSWRTLLFVVLAFAALWLYVNKLGKGKWAAGTVCAVLAVLVTIDLWGVDRRYLNEKNYVSEQKLKIWPDPWDAEIDQMAMQYGDEDYRVLNLAVNTFNDSKPSAFHHQVGGYSAVKMRRYQDLIDFYMSRRINMGVLNMLNTRYIVVQGGQVQRNPSALGNAWFVESVRMVGDANGEILALNTIDPKNQAVINCADEQKLNSIGKSVVIDDDTVFSLAFDSTATIVMEHQKPYNPDYLKYRTHAATDQLAVFSEIYYEPDWRVYIDGKPAEYMRANYVLRAMVIPAGDHVIEFKDEAPLYHRMNTVTIIGSIVLVLLAGGAIFMYYRKRKDA